LLGSNWGDVNRGIGILPMMPLDHGQDARATFLPKRCADFKPLHRNALQDGQMAGSRITLRVTRERARTELLRISCSRQRFRYVQSASMQFLRNSRVNSAAVAAVLFFAISPLAEARTPKWEYLVLSAGMKNRNLEQMLNARGAEGWELVGFTRKDVAVFKRVVR